MINEITDEEFKEIVNNDSLSKFDKCNLILGITLPYKVYGDHAGNCRKAGLDLFESERDKRNLLARLQRELEDETLDYSYVHYFKNRICKN